MGTVSNFATTCMAITAGYCIFFPFVMMFYLWIKKKANIIPFYIGCITFVLFAMILEAIFNYIIIVASPIGQSIQNNIWLYALIGGLMAGIFEETGRLVSMKLIQRKWDKDVNALMYGAGHGGIEAIVIGGVTMIGNLAMARMINAGQAAELTKGLDGAALDQMNGVIKSLVETPSHMYLFSLAERCSAIIVHVSLSVLVWFAVKKVANKYLYPVAIIIHAFFDMTAVILAHYISNIVAVELIIFMMAIFVAAFAMLTWRQESDE